MDPFQLLKNSVLDRPRHLVEPASWVGHIPFAAWLVEQVEPRLLVELGTHTGNSYFSFCQTVAGLGLGTQCHAVDTWEGDDQAGHYGEEVFTSVSEHNARWYGGFSSLLRMTFDEAVDQFSDGSIDLLHIDGLHTYDAVRHDFETWRPKLSERAVVLFHDTTVRDEGFGVWGLWEELSPDYPHLDFSHAHGLGVLFVGAEIPPGCQMLLEQWNEPAARLAIRRLFERLGDALGFELKAQGLQSEKQHLERRCTESEERNAAMQTSLEEGTKQIAHLTQTNQALEEELVCREARLATLEQQLASLQKIQAEMVNSKSWRLTRPLRESRTLVEQFALRVWQRLPLPFETRQRLKLAVFQRFPWLVRRFPGYRQWIESQVLADEAAWPEQDGSDYLAEIEATPVADQYVARTGEPPPTDLPVRLLAFYLPQFHPIPENDAWWGEGFTEWTNVRPAQPQFPGHYQPHVPEELGYYDLLDVDVQRRQVELAKLYGLGGFVFYFYWFAGKRMLEQPVRNYLDNPEFDLPFCLCWANENWSRRWDGRDHEILIAQQHSPEDDLAFIAHIARYFGDSRYIRINGRPLLIVYWPEQLPDPKATARRWRQWCRKHGVGEIYLAYTQSFEVVHPREYGFDAAIEFPPNNMDPPEITGTLRNSAPDFQGRLFDWRHFVRRSRHYRTPDYTLFRGCCPSWDNTARRKDRATVFLHNSPRAFREWIHNAVEETCVRIDNAEERLVFVNAWNEWAEGAHLEPDRKYGYAWLDAMRRGMLGEEIIADRGGIAVVSHDALPYGAQFLALEIVRALVEDLSLSVEVVLLDSGPLKKDFAALAPVNDLSEINRDHSQLVEIGVSLVQRGFRRAILSTTVSGDVAPAFREAGLETACLIHELPGVLRAMNLHNQALAVASAADYAVFPSKIVADGFAQFAEVPKARQVIRPQGLYRRNCWRYKKEIARLKLRERLGVAEDRTIILMVGQASRRKGVDLFVDIALTVLQSHFNVDFVWVGDWQDEDIKNIVEERLVDHNYRDHVHFVGFDQDTAIYHAGADVYALTSREDPFPNVVLESWDVAVPVVAFAGTGGGAEIVSQVGGRTVPAGNVEQFAATIGMLLDHPDLRDELGEAGQVLVDRKFSFRAYLFDLCDLLGLSLPRVSVIVPNYNYARYLEARLESIRRQTLPFYELIILDDASTDDSLARIRAWLADTGVDARLMVNSRNSGSVFAQWQTGVDQATGDYVWIAEADDLSDAEFLATVLEQMRSAEAVLGYTESCQIDSEGQILAANYQDYLAPLAPRTWDTAYVAEGEEEIRSGLAVMNTIPNVSAVVFRRAVLCEVFAEHFEEISGLTKAGDWMVYLQVLARGRIAFTPKSLNRHRRHGQSVIGDSDASALCKEIAAVQEWVARNYDLELPVRRQAAAYLAALHRQFSLSQTTGANAVRKSASA